MSSDRANVPTSDTSPDRSTSLECTAWDNGDCAGTPHCPPRCPRFVARDDTPLLIRPPEPDAWDRLHAMYEDVEETTLGLPPAERETRTRWLADLRETGWNLVARDGQRVVGHISVAPADDPIPEFVVFVHPEYRGHGVGTELVRQAVAYAAADHDTLRLRVDPENHRAISVYTNVGFEVVDRGVNVEMQLPLDDPAAETVRRPPRDRPLER